MRRRGHGLLGSAQASTTTRVPPYDEEPNDRPPPDSVAVLSAMESPRPVDPVPEVPRRTTSTPSGRPGPPSSTVRTRPPPRTGSQRHRHRGPVGSVGEHVVEQDVDQHDEVLLGGAHLHRSAHVARAARTAAPAPRPGAPRTAPAGPGAPHRRRRPPGPRVRSVSPRAPRGRPSPRARPGPRTGGHGRRCRAALRRVAARS